MKFLLGTKQKMTEIFDDTGRVYGVTRVSAGPIVVTALKTEAKDKYTAVQFGYGEKRKKNMSKAERGHQKLGTEAKTGFRHLRELSATGSAVSELKVGDNVTAAVFAPDDLVA